MRDDHPVLQAIPALACRHNAWVTGLNIVEVILSSMYMPDAMAVLATEECETKQLDTWWMNECRKPGILAI